MRLTARLLGQYLGAHRCAYADVEPDGDSFTIRADWSCPGMASSVGVYSLALFGSKAVHNLHHGRFLIVQDVDRELGDDDGGRMFNANGIRAIVCAPLVKSGRLVAMMAVHHATPRAWNGRELTLIGEVVDRCWAHIERVRTAALLREQDKRKDEFLATLAHELRNPLAPMRYALAALDRVPPGSSQAVQAQQVIDRQVHMMTRLVDDLLDLSRVNRGLIELRKERVDLREVLEHAAEACQGTLRAAGHELQLSLPPSLVSVDGDRDRLAQVVDNLLSNAAKYTPQGGQIRLAAWTAGTQSFIEVRDNGIGIPPEEQGKLFQIFTQLPHTARRSQGGLGIGLSLVKTLVQMHGGTVRVESAGLDQGSAFTVQLPLAAVPSDLSLPGGPTTSGKQGAVRVLVVEDNPDGRQSLVILLGLMGHQVASASDGEEGLDVALQFRPDVALVDLGLPKMDGLTLATAMRDHPQLARVTLVALTGWGTDKDRSRTKAAGFDQHFTKPVDPEALEALLAGLSAPPRHPSV
jgi:signal transduction histidine kinase